MTLTVTLLVLLAAILHAAWNALVKSTSDRLVLMAWIAAMTSVIGLPIALYSGVPDQEVWRYLLITLCIHTAYMLLLVRAFAHGDFGQVYPLARGIAPVIVTLAGYLLVGEALSLFAIFGICLVACGVTSLAWRTKNTTEPQDFRGVAYALATGVAIAAYSVVDGLGGRVAETPLAYTAWLFALHGIPITLITFVRRGPFAMFASRKVVLVGLGGAIMSMLAYGIVIWAMRNAPLGPVSALRETSVIFGALISALILKERLGPLAIVAAVIVAVGVFCLRL